MSERRYSQEEVTAIFERASETDRALPASAGSGLTLAALQDIAREVGISPESVSLAAESLDHTGTPASTTFLGLPIGVGRTVEFNRPLSDSDWEALVADLRTTFNAKGVLRYDGPFRQWTNGNLRVLLEPTPTGHRLRMQTVNGNARTLMMGGLAVLGVGVATFFIDFAAGGHKPDAVSTMGTMALIGMVLLATGTMRVRGWARLRMAQFEEIIARIVR
jgi:hypothetical protein